MKLQLNLSVLIQTVIAGLILAALIGAFRFYGEMAAFQAGVLQRLANIEAQLRPSQRLPNAFNLTREN